MIAFLRGEAGADVVSALLLNPNHHCLAHALNLCEVYYDFYRAGGREVATEAISDLAAVGVGWVLANSGGAQGESTQSLSRGLLRDDAGASGRRICPHVRSPRVRFNFRRGRLPSGVHPLALVWDLGLSRRS